MIGDGELKVIDQNGAFLYVGYDIKAARRIRELSNKDVSWCDDGAYIVIN